MKKHPMFGRKKPRYYVIKKASLDFAGHAYWEPRPADVEKYGVERRSLGHHSFGAMALADQHNQKLDALKMRSDAPRREPNPYNRGSFGKFYWRWSKKTHHKLAKASQQEWDTAWKRIGPFFQHRQLSAITPADIEDFVEELEGGKDPATAVTEYVRWRTINKLREIFNAAVAYRLIESSPCGTVDNPKPDGRTQIWLPHEVPILIKTAEDEGCPNMALALRLIYTCALSPIDSHTATVEMLVKDPGGYYLRRERSKMEGRKRKRRGIEADLPKDLYDDLMAHARRGNPDVDPHPKAVILVRDRTGKPYVDKSDFSADFKEIRDKAFPEEALKPRNKQRLLIDIRRTANVEAQLGGATASERAKLLANSIDTDDQLHKTYTPETAALTRQIAKQREAGRQALSEATRQEKAG